MAFAGLLTMTPLSGSASPLATGAAVQSPQMAPLPVEMAGYRNRKWRHYGHRGKWRHYGHHGKWRHYGHHGKWRRHYGYRHYRHRHYGGYWPYYGGYSSGCGYPYYGGYGYGYPYCGGYGGPFISFGFGF